MYGGQFPAGPYGPPGGQYGQPGDFGQPGDAGEHAGAAEYYDVPGLNPVARPKRSRWVTFGLIPVLLLVVGYLAYTRVYVPRYQHPAAVTAAPAAHFTAGAPLAAVPAGSSSASAVPGATTLPTLAWRPWLAGDGGKAFRGMELGDTVLVDARQKAQAALSSGKNIPAAGSALAKQAAAELKVVAAARTAPLPPKVAQPAWARAMTELTQGSNQLASAAKAMQANHKAAASRTIAASMPSMNAAFDDLNKVQEGIPAP